MAVFRILDGTGWDGLGRGVVCLAKEQKHAHLALDLQEDAGHHEAIVQVFFGSSSYKDQFSQQSQAHGLHMRFGQRDYLDLLARIGTVK